MTYIISQLGYYLPELVVILTMCALLFMEATYKSQTQKPSLFVYIAGVIGLSVALIFALTNFGMKGGIPLFYKAIVVDRLSTLSKIIMLVATLILCFFGFQSSEIKERLRSEYLIIVIGALFGGMLLVSASNFLVLYLGVETISILSYVLASLKRDDPRSLEGGIKYALYGGVSAAVMLYGISHIYGHIGTLDIMAMRLIIQQEAFFATAPMVLGFVFFFGGMIFKLAAFPFHMWAPDVYEGSPTPVTAFFSIVPKAAAVVALYRVSSILVWEAGDLGTTWNFLLTITVIMTILVGNITAIGQSSMKRLLAFSSIGHVGFILATFLTNFHVGHEAMFFYLISYLFMTMASFLILLFVQRDTGTDSINAFKGLLKRSPFLGLCLVITFFSLAGIPPLVGFISKYHVLSILGQERVMGVILAAVFGSVISLYYYLKVIKYVIFDESVVQKPLNLSITDRLMLLAVVLPIPLLGIFWNKLWIYIEHARATYFF